MHPHQRKIAPIIALLLMFTLTFCTNNHIETDPYEPILNRFNTFHTICNPMPETYDAPIYNPSAWCVLQVDGEEVWVYFDESNRADYLSQSIADAYDHVVTIGMRYILVYNGENPAIIKALTN